MTIRLRRHARLALAALVAVSSLVLVPDARASFQMMGARTLAMDAGSDVDKMDEALDHAVAAGVKAVVLNVNWADIEPSSGVYRDPGRCNPNPPDNEPCPGGAYIPGVFEKAREELIPRNLKVILNVRPIMGSCKVTPNYLMGTHWDDSVMIQKFQLLLWAIHDYLLTGPQGTLQVSLMTIGTEVDAHLKQDTNGTVETGDAAIDYSRYAAFIQGVRPFARSLSGWSTLPIGISTTHKSMIDDLSAFSESDAIAVMNATSTPDIDRVMFTYYPIDGAFRQLDPWNQPIADIPTVISEPNFAGRKFDIVEAGYSSSTAINGSREKQRIFMQAMFGIWDEYATPDPNDPIINTIVFNWQLDIGPRTTEYIVNSPWFGGGCAGGLPGAPPTPTSVQAQPVGGTGATTWKYTVQAVFDDTSATPAVAHPSLASNEVVVTNGVSTLSSSAYNRIWWPAVTGATSYKVSRTYVGGGNATPVPATTGVLGTTSYPEFWDQGWPPTTGVPPRVGTPVVTSLGSPGYNFYEYFVVAKTASGQSIRSVAGTTPVGASPLTATNKNRVTWSPVPGATSYAVYRSFVSPGGSPATTGRIATVNAPTTTLDDTGLAPAAGLPGEPIPPTITNQGTPGTKVYRYYIVAFNASGDSAPSLENETSTGAETLNSTNKNFITWPSVAGATGYRLYRSYVDAGTSTPSLGLIATTNSSTLSFTDSGVAATAVPATPGAPAVAPQGVSGTTTWRYDVVARRSYGPGAFDFFDSLVSKQGSTTTGRADLTTSNFNRISWAAVPGATKYIVYRSYAGPGAIDSTTGYVGETTGTSFDDIGLVGYAIPSGTQNFYEYIGTLGLRDFSPVVDKPAFDQLEYEALCRTIQPC